ncbi:MAG: class IV adenylate cyclase [Acidobacteriaceae bacterium]|nr:class IV adenylate cyclase [Acidobacteriaceae bacterium]
MQQAEIELKFPVSDAAALESRLSGLGFQLVTPRSFEHNTLYDTPARDLRGRHEILRVRRYGETWTVTHKRANGQPDSESRYKVRIETETAVADGEAIGLIFEQLGLIPVFVYEKYRTEWSAFDADTGTVPHLVLDETPIGIYAELEGPPAWIDRMVAALGVDPAACLTDSYGTLFLAWKQRTGSSAEHLTFAAVLAPA